jgi:heme-degrading monooxygenase HmoA
MWLALDVAPSASPIWSWRLRIALAAGESLYRLRLVTRDSDYPVLEVAVLDVRNGQAEAFREAFAEAEAIIASAPGFGGLELRRCLESDHRFLLLVHWDSVDSHEVGFRGSPEYQRWKELLHPFYDPFPVVEHYVVDRAVLP